MAEVQKLITVQGLRAAADMDAEGVALDSL